MENARVWRWRNLVCKFVLEMKLIYTLRIMPNYGSFDRSALDTASGVWV